MGAGTPGRTGGESDTGPGADARHPGGGEREVDAGDDGAGLNAAQREAVAHREGTLLILAGAGSGKTRVVAERIGALLDGGFATPQEILAVTFTNKATDELRERVAARVGPAAREATIGTFHAVAAKLLRARCKQLGLPQFTIKDDSDREKVLKELLRDTQARADARAGPDADADIGAGAAGTRAGVAARGQGTRARGTGQGTGGLVQGSLFDDAPRAAPPAAASLTEEERVLPPGLDLLPQLAPADVAAAIARAKQRLIRPGDLPMESPADALMGWLYAAYQARMARLNALDFDDLLARLAWILQDNPRTTRALSAGYRYVLVDEYQDTNHAQHALVGLLGGFHGNICVVGDDDQAIYAWRGGDLAHMLGFEEEYRGTRTVALERNYRSSGAILAAAHALVEPIGARHRKRLWTSRPRGERIGLHLAADGEEEARWVVAAAQASGAMGGPGPGDTAVLYRTNVQSRPLEEACLAAGVPYALVGGVRFASRREIRDLVAYLQVLMNPRDDLALGRILNVPARGLGERAAAGLHTSRKLTPPF